MSNDLNQCNFIGRLGREPDVRYLPSGEVMVNIAIAVGWKSKNKEGTEWVPIKFFGKLAEIVEQYLHKGDMVFVSGRFTTRKWQDKQGADHYASEITADKMRMLGDKRDRADAYSNGGENAKIEQVAGGQPLPGDFGDLNDDVPF